MPYRKNYMDGRYEIASKLEDAFSSEYEDVQNRPAEVLQVMQNAGPSGSYDYHL